MKFVQDLFKEQQLDEQEFDAITAQIMKGSDKKVEKYDAMNKLFEIMNRYEKQLTDPHEKYMYKIKRGEFLRQSQKQGIAFKPDIYSSKIEGELMTRRFSRYANTGQDAVRVFLENHFKNTFKEANSIDNGEARKAALEAMGTIAKGLASGNRNDFYDAKNNLKQCFENCIAQMNDETKKASEKYAQKVFDAFLKSLVF